MKGVPLQREREMYPTREALEHGEDDYSLAKRFALEYVKSYGDPVKAYRKAFGVSRQHAHRMVDDYLQTDCVKACLARVTAPTDTIASAGEVLAAITAELRAAEESKDRLKAAEILLKVRGHMDREKRTKQQTTAATQIVMLVKQYASASPSELEAELIGGGHALRNGVEEGGAGEDADGSGELDEAGEGDILVEPGSGDPGGGFAEGSPAQDEREEEVMQ